MGKKELQHDEVKGWNYVSGFIGNCKSCGKRLEGGMPVYWRWENGKEVICCRGCCDK